MKRKNWIEIENWTDSTDVTESKGEKSSKFSDTKFWIRKTEHTILEKVMKM